ncbi:phasin family protein [Paraburkholderia sp. J41]|uniref:phasin family protein n=1 Tax=Paraburkholderia sp. J41 TaxID=2805433 RepID=UPI002AC345E6|nr:phasin family protein [Paraburkholderia sp. J41]
MSDFHASTASLNPGASTAIDPALAANASWVGIWSGAAARLGDLTAQAIRTSLDEQRAIALAAAEESSPLGVWRLQTSYSLTGAAKTVAYFRHAAEIVLDTMTHAVADAEGRVNQHFLAMTGAMTHTAEQAAAQGESSLVSADASAQVADSAVRIVDAAGNAVSSATNAATSAATNAAAKTPNAGH